MPSSTNEKAKIISISNHKGGVGKTCSACNIGAGLARKGKKVLLIDLDPQANLSICLGIKDAERNIYELIHGRISAYQTIHYPTPNLDIIPSHLDLAGAEIELTSVLNREFVLRDILGEFVNDYDYIIIDCPPSLGLLTINALTASNMVFIPIQTEFLSLQGLEKLTNVIAKIQEGLNKNLKISGIIITQYNHRKSLNREIAEKVEEFYSEILFSTKIRDNVSLAESPCKGQDIFRYSPKSIGALDYDSLCDEILTITTKEFANV